MKLSRIFTILICFLGCTLFGSGNAAPAQANSFKNISAEEFDKLRADKANIVLDVRTAGEFAAGHIAGAKLMEWNGDDFDKKLATLEKEKVYLVHCAVGGRSARACKKMAQSGFSKVYNLEGGIKAWEKAGKPIER